MTVGAAAQAKTDLALVGTRWGVQSEYGGMRRVLCERGPGGTGS